LFWTGFKSGNDARGHIKNKNGGKMKSTMMHAITALLAVTCLMTTVSCARKTVAATPVEQTEQQPEPAQKDPALAPEPEPAAEETDSEAARLEASTLAAELAAEAAAQKDFLTRHIHFAFDSAALDEDARSIARAKAVWMAANPDVAVRIEGHCDQAGTPAYNMTLGRQRALAVKAYLASLGIAETRMTEISLGESVPITNAPGKAAARLNRRVQFAIQPSDL